MNFYEALGNPDFLEGETLFSPAVPHERAFDIELVSHRKVREKFWRMARQKAKQKTRPPVPFYFIFLMAMELGWLGGFAWFMGGILLEDEAVWSL